MALHRRKPDVSRHHIVNPQTAHPFTRHLHRLVNLKEVIHRHLLLQRIIHRIVVDNKTPQHNIPVIQADPKLVRIICQNLLTNAVKYTPTGGRIEIEISLNQKSLVYNENKPESYIRLKVSDNGYGIPQSEQANIFTKLYRADNVKEKDTEGTGLGLYIAKSVLDRVGGMIWFESGENKGTSFYVAIPIIGMKEKKGNKKLE